MLNLKVAFLNVGHGDFAYAVSPFGDSLVIDVGSGDVVPSSFLSKVTTIAELQVSHPHTDHFDDIVAMSKKTIQSFRCPQLDKFADRVIGWRKSDRVKIAKLRELKSQIPANGSPEIYRM
jgi:competence protein ComEC